MVVMIIKTYIERFYMTYFIKCTLKFNEMNENK